MKNEFDFLAPFQLTPNLKLNNRIVMAPMTRAMATPSGDPTQAMADYYSKRAKAGLIITEGTVISQEGTGYRNVPGLFSSSQIKQWKMITDKVHDKGGRIFAQIWHVGRVSHPAFIQGKTPLSPSKTTMSGKVKRENDLYYGTSREASLVEIQTIIKEFTTAAQNAIHAGFDGIEIHGANGYLLDQFLHYHTNQRHDRYGGSPENMIRFPLEVVHAIADHIDYQHIGIRLSPVGYLNEVVPNKRDTEVFRFFLKELNQLNIAYVHTGAFDDSITYSELNKLTMTKFIRQYYHKILIASGSYSLAAAQNGFDNKEFDLLSLGRPFIANPDLIDRIKRKKAWKAYDNTMLHTLD